MSSFEVTLLPTVAVTIGNVEADTQEEAIEKALAVFRESDFERLITHVDIPWRVGVHLSAITGSDISIRIARTKQWSAGNIRNECVFVWDPDGVCWKVNPIYEDRHKVLAEPF